MRSPVSRLVVALTLAAGLVAGPVATPASAYDSCKDGTIGGWSGTPSAKGQLVIPVGTGPATFYVNVREVMGEQWAWSIWLYQETNGEPGLQRGGTSPLGDTDSCQESKNPDQVLY